MMAENEYITPKNNNYLLGQNEAETVFLQAYKTNNLHHAWILSGQQGIGKSTLAYKIARFLLAADRGQKDSCNSLNVSENSPVFQQVANVSHPDLLVIERDYIETDRKKIISAIKSGAAMSEAELAGLKKSAFIRVDEVRKINDFLAKTSFNDGWRIVIIDSADDMNKNAANALLKILEEPPANTILLLISHNPDLLLPTIRSRCAKLPLKPLNDVDLASLLRRYRSNLNEAMIAKLVEISCGSIGRAVLYADNDAVEIYEDMCDILCARTNYSLEKLLKFSADMAADADKFAILQELLMKFLKENMQNCQDAEALYSCWNEARRGFADCLSVNMDKRLMLITLLTKICKVL